MSDGQPPECVHSDCERDAEVRVDFGPYHDTKPMCRHHAGFECRQHPTAETVDLEVADG